MDQVWFGSRSNSSPPGTRFNSVIGGLGWASTETPVHMVCPSAGTIKTLRVALEAGPGSGTSQTFTLMVDGVASALTVTISDSNTTGSDVSNQISVSAGQTLSLRFTLSGSPVNTHPRFTMIFTGSTTSESVLMAWGNTALNSGADEYTPLRAGVGFGKSTTELDMQQLCAGTGTIKNLYVILSADPGDPGAPDGYRFTVRKNGASQSLTVLISADNTTGNDTSNSFSVVPGDLLTVLIEPVNTPSAAPTAALSATFVADTDGESLVLGGSDDDVHATTTEHYHIAGFVDDLWGAGESSKRTIMDICTFRDLYVELENAPGAGNSFVFSPRVHTNDPSDPAGGYSDGNLSVTISGTDTTGSDTSNVDNMATDESIVIQSNPDSAPTVGQAKWGVVMFIAVAAKASRGSLITRLEAAGII